MISNKFENITPSFTIDISSKVKELKNNGIDVIDLSIGEPIFPIPKMSKLYGIESLINNMTKYDNVSGIDSLKEKICEKLYKENRCYYTPDEIVVSSGAKHAITNTILALLNVGDEVLIPKPYWVSYPEIVKLLNCVPVFIQTSRSNNFKVSVDDLKASLTSHSRLLILNNPCNPTGCLYTRQELINIVEFCYDNNIYILSDEIYEQLTYDDNFISVASLSNKSKDITITINGFSKSSSMTGLRIGYTASNKKISRAISTIQGHLTSHPSLTSQYIAYGILSDCLDDINKNTSIYKSKRDLTVSILDLYKNIDYIYPSSTFYTFIDLSCIANVYEYSESLSILFCKDLLDKYNVAIVPGIAFGLDNWVRVSFSANNEDIVKGVTLIMEFINYILENNIN